MKDVCLLDKVCALNPSVFHNLYSLQEYFKDSIIDDHLLLSKTLVGLSVFMFTNDAATLWLSWNIQQCRYVLSTWVSTALITAVYIHLQEHAASASALFMMHKLQEPNSYWLIWIMSAYKDTLKLNPTDQTLDLCSGSVKDIFSPEERPAPHLLCSQDGNHSGAKWEQHHKNKDSNNMKDEDKLKESEKTLVVWTDQQGLQDWQTETSMYQLRMLQWSGSSVQSQAVLCELRSSQTSAKWTSGDPTVHELRAISCFIIYTDSLISCCNVSTLLVSGWAVVYR